MFPSPTSTDLSMSDVLQTAPPTDCSAPRRFGQGAHHAVPQEQAPTDPTQTPTTLTNVLHPLPVHHILHKSAESSATGIPPREPQHQQPQQQHTLDLPVTALHPQGSGPDNTGDANSYSYPTLFPSPSFADSNSIVSSALVGRANSVLTTVFYTARTSLPSRASTIHSTRSNRTNNAPQRLSVSSNDLYHGGGEDDDFLTVLSVLASAIGIELGLIPDEREVGEEEEEEEEEAANDATDNDVENDRDSLIEYELAHLPPYLPEIQPYIGFGRSLRETVLNRQNTRVFPPEDRLQERMEDQLVCWGPPQSLFHVQEILNGKHAFQKDDMPVLEVVPRPKDSDQQETSSADEGSSSTGTTLTESTVNSIARSPFCSERTDRVPTRFDLTPKSSFLEDNSGATTGGPSTANGLWNSSMNGTALGIIYEIDQNTIQQSPPYLLQSGSPSFTSSMRLQLNRSHSHLNTPTGSGEEEPITKAIPVLLSDVFNNQDCIVDQPTPEAMPVSMDEMREMVKNPPPLQSSVREHQLRLHRLNGDRRYQDYARFGNEEELTFWQAVCEVWTLCCDDMSACLSCQWLFEEPDPEMEIHYRFDRGSDDGPEIESQDNDADLRLPRRREHTI